MRDAVTHAAIATLHGMLDVDTVTAAWEVVLRAPAWEGAPVWIHGDLSPLNVLLERGRLSAVIDFGCLGIGDPACDLQIAGVLIQASAHIAVVAGISATLQNYRTRASVRPAPSWLRPLLLVLSGVVVGMSLVALIVAANPFTSSASSTTNDEPTVHMGAVKFVKNVVLVPKGSKLLIVNDTTVEHILQNGSWTTSGKAAASASPVWVTHSGQRSSQVA